MKIVFKFFIILLMLSCKSTAKDLPNFERYKEPTNIESLAYEVKTVIPKSYKSYNFQFDSISKCIYITKALEDGDSYKYMKLKLNYRGDIIDSFPNNEILRDATILNLGDKSFSTKLINGNSDFYKIHEKKAANEKEWLKKFDYAYKNSELFTTDYLGVSYFKVKKSSEYYWFYLEDNFDLLTKEFKKEHPTFNKNKDVIIFSKDITPYFFIKNRNKRNELSSYSYQKKIINSKSGKKRFIGLIITTPSNENLYIKWGNSDAIIYSFKDGEEGVLFIRGKEDEGIYVIRKK